MIFHHGEALRRAEKEHSLGVQPIMKERKQLFLSFRPEIDQQVATGDEIEFGERRVLQDVVQRKDNHIPDMLLDMIAVLFLRKEAGQALGRDIALDPLPIKSPTGRLDGFAVQIRRKNLHAHAVAIPFHPLLEQNG